MKIGTEALVLASPKVAKTDAPKPAAEDKVGSEPGVIRNLQNGHYKGVADVRLRIVHAEKLAALQAESFGNAFNGATESFVAALEPVIAALPVAGFETDIENEVTEPDTAAVEAAVTPLGEFVAGVSAAVAAAQSAPVADAAPLETDLRNAFDQLIVSLGLSTDGAVVADAPDSSDIANGVDTESAGDATPVRDYLAELTNAFEATLMALLEGASAAAALPPLSEPAGNGAAYQKFLDQYQQIQADGQEVPVAADEPAADGTSAAD